MRSNAVACQRWQRRVLASMSGRAPAALATTMAASSGHLASMPAPRTAFAPGGLCAQGDRISVRNPIQMRARRGEVRPPPGGEGDGNGTRVRCPWPENGAIWWPQNWGHLLSGQQEWGPPGGPIFDPVFAPLAPPRHPPCGPAGLSGASRCPRASRPSGSTSRRPRCIISMDSRRGHGSLEPQRQKRSARCLTEQVSRSDTGARMSVTTFIGDDPAVQPLQPQVLLGNKMLQTEAETAAAAPLLPQGDIWGGASPRGQRARSPSACSRYCTALAEQCFRRGKAS